MDREFFVVASLENGFFYGRGTVNAEHSRNNIERSILGVEYLLRVFVDEGPDVVATIRFNVRDQLFFLQLQRNVGYGAVDINAITRADAAQATGDINRPADIVVAHFKVTGEAKADTCA